MGIYQFPRNFLWSSQGVQLSPGTLLVTVPGEPVGESAYEIKDIFYPDGKIAYKIYLISDRYQSRHTFL